MTLPSTICRPTVDFNNFDVMASTNIDYSMLEQPLQQLPEETENDDVSSIAHFNNNNNNNNNVNNNNNNIVQSTVSSSNNTITPSATSTTLTVATASTGSETVFSSQDLAVESVMPGIYFTKNFVVWNEENLRAHGFTHIIIIDKHIQELYYPSPVFKLSTLNKNNELYESTSPFDYFCSAPIPPVASLNFSKEFEAIDLNFGEKSYLTTVLPNCYRAVRFINKALQSGGTILVIDCNGGEQKCLTIIVAYLMYKYNISFSNAFARLKSHYKKADLDRFYISQLYEYEPILQVQRAQSRGHSCSRELHAAILKRKKVDDDFSVRLEGCAATGGSLGLSNNKDDYIFNASAELLHTLNPLSQFYTSIAQQQQTQQQMRTNEFEHVAKQQMTGFLSHEKTECFSKLDIINSRINHTNLDDYAME